MFMTRTSRRAIRCTVVSVSSHRLSHVQLLITSRLFWPGTCASCLCICSCKRPHVREPPWTENVRRRQRGLVHFWTRHRSGHPRRFLWREHLQAAEDDAGRSQRVPTHHRRGGHAAKHSRWVLPQACVRWRRLSRVTGILQAWFH